MYKKSLDTLVTVAKTGSINKAAKYLFLRPSTVLKHIVTLEKEYNVLIFDRSKDGCVLTDDGKIIYEAAKRIISISQETLANINTNDNDLKIIRFGVFYFETSGLLYEKVWNKFSTEFNNYVLETIPMFTGDTYESIILNKNNYDIDIATGINDYYCEFDCDYLEICKCKQKVLLSKRHKLANKECFELNDFNNEKIVVFKKGLLKSFDELIENISVNIPEADIIELPSNANVVDAENMCSKENCLFLASSALDNINPDLVSIPIKNGKEVSYGIYYSANSKKEVDKLIKYTKKVILEIKSPS